MMLDGYVIYNIFYVINRWEEENNTIGTCEQ